MSLHIYLKLTSFDYITNKIKSKLSLIHLFDICSFMGFTQRVYKINQKLGVPSKPNPPPKLANDGSL
jgi:hypothetical protein